MGRTAAWDELSLFVIWKNGRVGRIVAWDELSPNRQSPNHSIVADIRIYRISLVEGRKYLVFHFHLLLFFLPWWQIRAYAWPNFQSERTPMATITDMCLALKTKKPFFWKFLTVLKGALSSLLLVDWLLLFVRSFKFFLPYRRSDRKVQQRSKVYFSSIIWRASKEIKGSCFENGKILL